MPVGWSMMSCILFCLQWKKFQHQQKMEMMAWRERRCWVSFKFWKGWRKSPICRSAGDWHEFNNVSNKASNFETSDFRHLFFWSEKESVLSSIKVENLLRPASLIITVHTCTVNAIKIEQCKGYNWITPESRIALRFVLCVSKCLRMWLIQWHFPKTSTFCRRHSATFTFGKSKIDRWKN